MASATLPYMSVLALQVSDFKILNLTVYISQIIFLIFRSIEKQVIILTLMNQFITLHHSFQMKSIAFFEQALRGEDVVNYITSDKINSHV